MATRTFMRADLPAVFGEQDSRVRSVTASDTEALSHLLFDAYLGTIDQEEDTLDQARLEVGRTFSGDYGVFNPTASKVLCAGGRLLSAVLVTHFQNTPFVAFTITSPAHKGQGLVKVCMLAAMADLAGHGESELRLVVTLANEPAMRLYRSVGFKAENAA